VVAIVLWLLPSNEWRLTVGGLLALGVLVFGLVM
jgi:hypothetical protein